MILSVDESLHGGQDLNNDGDVDDQVPHVHDLETDETWNLGLAAGNQGWQVSKNWLVFTVSETGQDEDLNDNGKIDPHWLPVVHVHNLESRRSNNLGLIHDSGTHRPGWRIQISGDWVVFRVEETHQADDLNDDGDIEDVVLHVQNLETGQTAALEETSEVLASARGLKGLVSMVSESVRGEDLNGDGDTGDEVFHVLNLETGETQNLELASGSINTGFCKDPVRISHSESRIALGVWERGQQVDLNGDGDLSDHVLHVHDLETGHTRNLGVDVNGLGPFSADWLVSSVDERCDLVDVNGDGDHSDRTALQVYNLESGRLTNLGVAGTAIELSGKWLALTVSEGFTRDVLHVINLESGDIEEVGPSFDRDDLAFFGKYLVFSVGGTLHTYNLEENETENLAAEWRLSGDWLAFESLDSFEIQVLDLATGETRTSGLLGKLGVLSERWLAFTVSEFEQRQDLNDDGDEFDEVVHVISLPTRFLRGDCTGDGDVNLSDAVCILNWLFVVGETPGCVAATNTNGDDARNLSNATYLLNHLFSGGPAPVAPFPDCGPGTLPADTELGCANPLDCQ